MLRRVQETLRDCHLKSSEKTLANAGIKKKTLKGIMITIIIIRKERQVLRLCLRTEKSMEHYGDGGTSGNWWTRNSPLGLGKGAGRVENQRTSRDHPNYCIVKICPNTEKSPEELMRLAVIKTRVKNHKPVWNSQGINYNSNHWQEKITGHQVDFDVPVDQQVKIKESETINKYLDLAGELQKLWNVKIKVIAIVDEIKTIPKDRGKKEWIN